MGELIVEGQENGKILYRGGDRKSKSHDVTLKLEDIGIEKMQSSRAQKLARVDEEQINDYCKRQQEDDEDISEAGPMRYVGSGPDIKGKQTGEMEWYTPLADVSDTPDSA